METLPTAKARVRAARDDYERACAEQMTALDNEELNLDNKERDIQTRLEKLNERKRDIAATHGILAATGDDLIEVNAGGAIVAARRSTFTQIKGSKMEALFGGRWDKKLLRDSDGRIFLDVNPDAFRAIVDHLNEMAISPENSLTSLPHAGDEHEHVLRHQFELFGMLDRAVVELPDSNIIKDEGQVTQLQNWLKEIGSDEGLNLLYRSSRDGLAGEHFHSKCSNQGCTLTVIETTEGFVLGGYSNTPWKDIGLFNVGYAQADRAFLFVLSGSDIASPLKMNLRNANDTKAIYIDGSFPRFGACDFSERDRRRRRSLLDNRHDLWLHGSKVYLKFGGTYESGPPGRLATPAIIGAYTILSIKEVEVFQVGAMTSPGYDAPRRTKKTKTNNAQINQVTRFTEKINEAINARQESLRQAESEILHLEDSLKEEQNFVASFATGNAKDIVRLNVSGTPMVTKRSTLQAIKDSVLARQFDDSKWTEQGCNSQSVKDWSPDDVNAWIKNIPGIPDDVVSIFRENKITGFELLALDKDGLVMLGITRPGTVCVIKKEIKKLEKACQDIVTLIEHSPYCFGKILDFLRLKQLHSQGLAREPVLPKVCDLQKIRFEKVVRYYFPGESATVILGQLNL